MFSFCISSRPDCQASNTEGVITHAHNRHWYALNERFRHAQLGACFKRCRLFEITSFVVTAAEAANYVKVLFFLHRDFSDERSDSCAFPKN
jgi:hypothetical protein